MTTPSGTGQRRRAASGQLKAGLKAHQLGRLDEASRLYRSLLAAEPNNIDAHHLSGLLALSRHQIAAASIHFSRAVELSPATAAYRSNYGHTLRLVGEVDRAEAELRQAVQIDPTFAEAWINLGLVLLDLERVSEAIVALETSVRCEPGSALGHLNLGSALLRAGRFAESGASSDAAIALAPGLVPAYRNLGVAAHQLGALERAKTAYLKALALGPADPDVLTNLGIIFLRQGEVAESLLAHERAVAVAPSLAAAWLNRGTALQAAGRLDEARDSFERAVTLDARGPSFTALGNVVSEQGNFAGAVSQHEAAVAWNPAFADGHWNLALALLAGGNLGRGWDEYEWRWGASSCSTTRRAYPWPDWPGPAAGPGRILIWREQGLGDELLFLTCLPDLVALGLVVTVLVSPRLLPLLRRSFPTVTVVADEAGASAKGQFDWQLPLGSLPGRLRRSRPTFDDRQPYLVPAPARVTAWQARLGALPPGKRIGVCWRTGLLTAERRRHYPSVDECEALWQVPGVVWVNLQYDECDAEVALVAARWRVTIHRWPGDDLRDDLDGVAALIAGLDGVVTAPTAVSSLAGAVGTPTWLVDSGSDWSSFGEDRSPWFPSIQVARKMSEERTFGPVVERVALELAGWARGGAG